MICKKCGKELDKKAVICPGCGCKIKKPIYKKWWFWVVVVIVVIAVAGSSGNDEGATVTESNTAVETEATSATESNAPVKSEKAEEIVYEIVDLQVMFDALEENAMKAEKNYQNKFVEFDCKISSFDSDGQYISVEPVGASEWNFTTATCYIKNDAQKDYLIEKSVGDIITVKGKIKSIGEIVGYSIDIKEVY